jgi:hypothetical protein
MDELFSPALVVYAVAVVGALVVGRAFRSVHKRNVERMKALRRQAQPQKSDSDFMTSRFGNAG